MSTYALIDNGTVVNVILWDGVEYSEETPQGWTPPEGMQAVELDGSVSVSPGYTYDGTTFTAPPPPPAPVLTPDQIKAANLNTQNALVATATSKIAIYTDATDPDLVDTVAPADTAALKAWKQYRIAVNKIDLTQASPVWPIAPQT